MKIGRLLLNKMPWIVLVIQFLLVIYVVNVFQVDDVTLHKGTVYDFNTGWTLIRENGSQAKITLPYHEDVPAGEVITIKNTLLPKHCGKTLSFLSADKNVRISVDGTIIYTFGVNDKRTFGKTPGSVTNFVDIPENVSEGEIVVQLVSPYDNFAGTIDTMIIARRDIAVFEMMKKNYLQFACALLILGAGGIFGVLAWSSKAAGNSTEGTEYLTIYCLLSFIFYSIETKAMNLFYGNQTLYSVLVFLILMSLPIFMVAYYIRRFQFQDRLSVRIVYVISWVNPLLQIPLQIFNVFDFMDMAAVSHAILFVAIWVMFFNLYQVERNARSNEYRLEFAGLISLGMCGLFDIIRAYTETTDHIEKTSRYGATVFCLFMLLSHLLQLIKRYTAALEENAKLLEQKAQEAEQKNEYKSAFLAQMSHEIRTPIHAIIGMNSMIMQEAKEDSIRGYAEDVDSATHSLLGIINEILDLSKIEAGKMELTKVEYETAGMLYDALNMIAVRAQNKGLSFYIEVDDTIPMKLYGDDLKLRQVLINILSNAVKYTERGGVTFRVTGEKSEDGREAILHFSVTDTGIGIKEENIPKLFEAFERIEEDRNRVIEGTGLGMNITVKFLRLMDSKLEVESRYGFGSTFSFTVRQKIVNAVPIGDFTKRFRDGRSKYEKAESAQVMQSQASAERREATEGNAKVADAHIGRFAKKVLLVDDNALNRKVFMALLKNADVVVTQAASGHECLELVKKEKFSVIFLDHMMPIMDGVETLQRMKEMKDTPNRSTPVIALTANEMEGGTDFYESRGFDGFLGKPIEQQLLMDILNSV